MRKEIIIHPGDTASFRNLTDYCVGTGRLDLALHQEYQQELSAVQALCHFRHIRGHGLFSDQMGIWQEFGPPFAEKRRWFCFTYLDRVMDAYLENGLEPFLELGFMPEKLASSDQTLFYWKAHTVPPKDPGAWCLLVRETLKHLVLLTRPNSAPLPTRRHLLSYTSILSGRNCLVEGKPSKPTRRSCLSLPQKMSLRGKGLRSRMPAMR